MATPQIAKSIEGFKNILGKNGIKGDLSKIVDNTMFANNGTGSMLVDFLTRKNSNRIRTVQNMQRKLADADMKLGGKAYDFLDKKKSRIAQPLKKSLVQEHDILKNKGVWGAPDEYLKVKSTGILNPISKIKSSALPFIGSMTVANHLLSSNKDDNNTAGGDNYYG